MHGCDFKVLSFSIIISRKKSFFFPHLEQTGDIDTYATCLLGFRTLSQDVEEGICQVLAHMWLLTQLDSASSSNVASSSSSASSRLRKGKRPQFERKLGEFFKHQIESDTSPVYGDGFRAGHQAVYKYGLRKTLEHIRMTGRFPY